MNLPTHAWYCGLALIIKHSKEQQKNPYKQEIFTDTKDFHLAMARAEK